MVLSSEPSVNQTLDCLDKLEFFDFVKFTEDIRLPVIQCFQHLDRLLAI